MGFISLVSGYGRGTISMMRFFVLWQLWQVARGETVSEIDIPRCFTYTSLCLAPFLSVDWIVAGYNQSVNLGMACYEKDDVQTKQIQYREIAKALYEHLPALIITLFGAVGHSFVAHRSIQALGEGLPENSHEKTAFETASWVIPAICALQYLLSESQHMALAFQRSLRLENYTSAMNFKGMSKAQQVVFVFSHNATAILCGLLVGMLDFTESYYVLRNELNTRRIDLGSEIAFVIAMVFGIMGTVNAYIADGERFRSFCSRSFRDAQKIKLSNKNVESVVALAPLKIPSLTDIFQGEYRYRLMGTGLLALLSSLGLGTITYTAFIQFLNVFIQFYDPKKPFWAPTWILLITLPFTGILPATVFFIAKGRYIYKEWRHSHTGEKGGDPKTQYRDERMPNDKDKNKNKIYAYRITHFGLDALQFTTILGIKLTTELTKPLKLAFLPEIAVMYLISAAAALLIFLIEEISPVRKPVNFNESDVPEPYPIARRVLQSLVQLGVPIGSGVLLEYLLHGAAAYESVPETTRLNFSHIIGTIAAALLTVLSKRALDYAFKPSILPELFTRCIPTQQRQQPHVDRDEQRTQQSEEDAAAGFTAVFMTCCMCSFFAGVAGASVTAFVGFFGREVTNDPSDPTLMYGFFTGAGIFAGCFTLLVTAAIAFQQCRNMTCIQTEKQDNAIGLASVPATPSF